MMGSTEILVVGGVVVLLFGATAIPKFARSLGKAKKEFRDGVAEGADEAAEKEEQKKKE